MEQWNLVLSLCIDEAAILYNAYNLHMYTNDRNKDSDTYYKCLDYYVLTVSQWKGLPCVSEVQNVFNAWIRYAVPGIRMKR